MAITYLSPGTTDIRQIVFAVNQALERLQYPPTWVGLAAGSPRWQATSGAILYVDNVNGSDSNSASNDGLSAGRAFKTIQYAWDILRKNIDPRGVTPTIQLPLTTSTPITEAPNLGGATPDGLQEITIQGNSASPTSCQWQPASGTIDVFDYASVTFKGVGFSIPGGSGTLISGDQYSIADFFNCDFGANPGGVNISMAVHSSANVVSGCSISGSCGVFAQLSNFGSANFAPLAIKGAPNVGIFVNALYGGLADLSTLSFTSTSSAVGLQGQQFLARWGGAIRGNSSVTWSTGMATGVSTLGGITDAGVGL